MAQCRAYVPSMALLRVLARPHPLRCPVARPLPAQFVRGKKTKAAKAREAEKARLAAEARKAQRAEEDAEQREIDADAAETEAMLRVLRKDKTFAPFADEFSRLYEQAKDPDYMAQFLVPPVFKEGEDPGVDFYEEDIITGKRRKVDKLGTVADQIRRRETYFMMLEDANNPDYDDAELRKRAMDDLIADPEFASLTEELKEIKADIMTKEEEQQALEEANREAQPMIDELNAEMRKDIRASLTKLINDPDIGDESADVQAVLDYLPNVQDFEDPQFVALMDRANNNVNRNPKLRAKIKAIRDSRTPEERELIKTFQRNLEELTQPPTEEEMDMSDEEIAELMQEMRGVLKEMKRSGNLDAQFEKLLSDSDQLERSERFEADAKAYFDDDENVLAELPPAIKRLAEADRKPGTKPTKLDDAEEDEHIPPELAAKVDKIMADPRLMEKLDYISKLIEQHIPVRDPNDLTQIDAKLAPDPYEMNEARTATLAQRMAAARADPEHNTAMRALRVKLAPPYNISPTLTAFNQAIEFAYIGANDDVRRVLWRTYQKARTLPTFLQNLTDDAWDILYYSQAVTWTGNQNRTDHLKMLLEDLKVAGRSGPPTHPSQLGQHQEAARLEAAQKEQMEATRAEGEIIDAQRTA